MQTNDFNKLLTSYEGFTFDSDCSLNNIKVSEFTPCNKWPSKKQLQESKKPISLELLNKVRSDVRKFEEFGKSRRWIRRYIKRKYNIVEY